jgi:hypothetical protein
MKTLDLEHVIREVWTQDHMCSGLPAGTRFNWLPARDHDFVVPAGPSHHHVDARSR